MRVVIASFVAFLFLASQTCRTALYERGGARTPTSDEQRSLVRKIAAGREKLKSGEYLLHGSMSRREWPKPEEIAVDCVFDLSAGCSRFHARVPVAVAEPTRIIGVEAFFVRRPDLSFDWVPASIGDQAILIHSPTYEPLGYVHYPLDIRLTGLEVVGSWVMGRADLADLLATYGEDRLIAVEALDGRNIVRADWLHVSDSERQKDILSRLWLDVRLDYACIRHDVFLCSANDEGQISGNLEPYASMVVDWKMMEGIAVPVAVSAWEGKVNARDVYKLSIEWMHVNAPIRKAAFEMESLGLPGHTSVFDTRGKPAIDLGRLDHWVPTRN